MSNKFQTKQFKKLQDTWYKKLEKSGFNDIEINENLLYNYDSTFFINKNRIDGFGFKEEYYRLAGQFLHEYQFKNTTDRLIWEFHSSGDTYRTIAAKLVKLKIKPNSECKVHRMLKELKIEFQNKYGKQDDKSKRSNQN